MLSFISMTELTERVRQMRAAKDVLVSKEVALSGGVHVQSKPDECIATGLVFKRRRCRHTKIGGGYLKSISGGERKRTSIGYEILVHPSLLLFYEPTFRRIAHLLCLTWQLDK
ncbi:hypothetical protein VNO80_25116 [Phaseolus coccineus]|uniref:ABC transporter domain-containing protein n=1 Tax=Phaseolus coccineus TaxID=3886 RepID=A0AAN9LYW1_PHACN